MMINKLCIWGDSIAKGVVFDEQRGRYTVYKDNCIARISRESGWDVKNFAVMGSTSEQGLKRMREQELPEGGIAVIEFGGNDCDLNWREAAEHPENRQNGKIPVAGFKENVTRMVELVRRAGMKPVLVTPPPLVAQRYFDWVCRGLDAEKILNYLGDVEHIYRWQERYAVTVQKLARELSAELLDVRSLFLNEDNFTELMCIDGIHPNREGQDRMYEAFHAVLA